MRGGRVSIALAAGIAFGVLATAAPGADHGLLPAPEYGRTVNLQRVSGVVRVRPPGAPGFSRLRKARTVRVRAGHRYLARAG